MLIKESTLRRIIREEAQRVLREDAVGMDLVRQAHDAVFTKTLPNGQKIQSAGGQSPFNDYLLNYRNVFDKVKAAIAALPNDAPTRPSILGGFTQFAKSGSGSPAASVLLSLKNSNPSPAGRARAALVIFADGKYDPMHFDERLGIGVKPILGGFGVSSGDPDRKKVDAAIGDPANLLDRIYAMASYDIAGETRRVLPASQASVGGSAPGATQAAAGRAVNVKLDLEYVVKPGDSVSKILATYYGIPASEASTPLYTEFSKNMLGDPNPNKIKVGARIRLPATLRLGNRDYPLNRKANA